MRPFGKGRITKNGGQLWSPLGIPVSVLYIKNRSEKQTQKLLILGEPPIAPKYYLRIMFLFETNPECTRNVRYFPRMGINE
jgi:hypothetical protein